MVHSHFRCHPSQLDLSVFGNNTLTSTSFVDESRADGQQGENAAHIWASAVWKPSIRCASLRVVEILQYPDHRNEELLPQLQVTGGFVFQPILANHRQPVVCGMFYQMALMTIDKGTIYLQHFIYFLCRPVEYRWRNIGTLVAK